MRVISLLQFFLETDFQRGYPPEKQNEPELLRFDISKPLLLPLRSSILNFLLPFYRVTDQFRNTMAVGLHSNAVFIRARAFGSTIKVFCVDMEMLNGNFHRFDRALFFGELRMEIVTRRHFSRLVEALAIVEIFQ